MLPLNYAASTNTLYLAFGERVDHAALYAIEKILDCRTQPCVARRKSIARQLDFMRQLPHPSDVEFGPMNDLAEMGRIASSYTARLTPGQVHLCRIGRFIWLRLDARAHVGTGAPSASSGQALARVGTGALARPAERSSASRSIPTNLVFRLSTDSPRPLPFTRNERPLRAPQTP